MYVLARATTLLFLAYPIRTCVEPRWNVTLLVTPSHTPAAPSSLNLVQGMPKQIVDVRTGSMIMYTLTSSMGHIIRARFGVGCRRVAPKVVEKARTQNNSIQIKLNSCTVVQPVETLVEA